MLSWSTADTFLLSVVYFSLDITSTATLSCFPLSLFTHCSREHQNACDRRTKKTAHAGCYDNYVTVYIETVALCWETWKFNKAGVSSKYPFVRRNRKAVGCVRLTHIKKPRHYFHINMVMWKMWIISMRTVHWFHKGWVPLKKKILYSIWFKEYKFASIITKIIQWLS